MPTSAMMQKVHPQSFFLFPGQPGRDQPGKASGANGRTWHGCTSTGAHTGAEVFMYISGVIYHRLLKLTLGCMCMCVCVCVCCFHTPRHGRETFTKSKHLTKRTETLCVYVAFGKKTRQKKHSTTTSLELCVYMYSSTFFTLFLVLSHCVRCLLRYSGKTLYNYTRYDTLPRNVSVWLWEKTLQEG